VSPDTTWNSCAPTWDVLLDPLLSHQTRRNPRHNAAPRIRAVSLSPKRYLLLRRMALARRALRAAATEKASVTDIAMRYGIWEHHALVVRRFLRPVEEGQRVQSSASATPKSLRNVESGQLDGKKGHPALYP